MKSLHPHQLHLCLSAILATSSLFTTRQILDVNLLDTFVIVPYSIVFQGMAALTGVMGGGYFLLYRSARPVDTNVGICQFALLVGGATLFILLAPAIAVPRYLEEERSASEQLLRAGKNAAPVVFASGIALFLAASLFAVLRGRRVIK